MVGWVSQELPKKGGRRWTPPGGFQWNKMEVGGGRAGKIEKNLREAVRMREENASVGLGGIREA